MPMQGADMAAVVMAEEDVVEAVTVDFQEDIQEDSLVAEDLVEADLEDIHQG